MKTCLRAAAMAAAFSPTLASASPVLDWSDITHEHGPACAGLHWSSGDGIGSPGARSTLGPTNPNGSGRQTVFVDFAGDATFVVGLIRLDGSRGRYVAPNGRDVFDTFQFSADHRATVLNRLRQDYAGFNYEFTDTRPVSGEFARLQVNNTAIRRVTPTVRAANITAIERDTDGDGVADRTGFNILFGLAEGIDFRNKSLTNGGAADGNFFGFIDQAGLSISGLSPATTADRIVAAAAQTASHELGHAVGLRHHDALGPVGTGVNGLGQVGRPANWYPEYPGPADAFATNNHIMSSGASTGRPLDPMIDRHFGVREAMKLAFNEQGVAVSDEGLRAVAAERTITLPNFALRDGTVIPGDETGVSDVRRAPLRILELPELTLSDAERQFYGKSVITRATTIEGRITRPLIEEDGSIIHDLDMFALNLEGGSFLSVEALASTPIWIEEPFFPVVGLFDADFNLLRFFAGDAVSFQDPEGGDPFLLDFRIDTTGLYHLGIWSPYNFVDRWDPRLRRGEFISGLYELYITNVLFDVPAPPVMALFGVGAAVALLRRRAGRR